MDHSAGEYVIASRHLYRILKRGRAYQVMLLAAVVVGTAVGDYVLSAGILPPSLSLSSLLPVALYSQWYLLAVVCALAGRNAICGLLFASALSPFAIGAVLLGASRTGTVPVDLWVPLALFPWLLPASAIPFSLVRLGLGWRLVEGGTSPPKAISLADLFSLIVFVAYGVVAFRCVHILAEDQYKPLLREMGTITGLVAVTLLVVGMPSLGWLSRVQSHPVSASLFFLSMTICPSAVSLAALWYEPQGIGGMAAEMGPYLWPLLLFGYSYGCLWLLWHLGFRLETRRHRPATSSASGQLAAVARRRSVAGWLPTAWLLLIAVIAGIWSGQIDLQKRREAAWPEFLKRVKANQFRKGQRPSVAFRPNSVADSDLKKYLAGANDLHFLNLSQNPISDRGLRSLRMLPDLKEIGLAGTLVTDRGMVELAKLTNLRLLDLANTAVTEDGLSRLDALTELQVVGLQDCRIGDPACDVLRRFHRLDTLELGQTGITDSGITELAGLTELRILGVSSTSITDAGLQPLKGLLKLKALDVTRTRVTGTGFAAWDEQRELMFLFADDSDFSDSGLESICKFSGLNLLRLNRTHVTDAGMAALARHASLRQVYLDETEITDHGAKRLFGMPQLLRLSLVDTAVGDDAFRDWKPPPALLNLHLDGTRVTDDAFQYLAKSRTLEALTVARTAVTATGIRQLAGSSVKSLYIGATSVKASDVLDANISSLRGVVVDAGQFSPEEIGRLKSAGISVTQHASHD